MTYRIRLPPAITLVIMKLREGSSSRHRAACIVVDSARSLWCTRLITPIPLSNTLRLIRLLLARLLLLLLLLLKMWPLVRRCAYHEQETFLCRRQLGDIMIGMRATDMLLHGAIPLLLKFMSHQPHHSCIWLVALRPAVQRRYRVATAISRLGVGGWAGSHLRRCSACGSWSHLGCAADRQPRCWHP